MKRNVTVITLLLLILSTLSGCGHQHVWKEATCTEPNTCTECGETEGSPIGHTWTAATCTSPKTCNVCGETEGTALAHTWSEATCTTPKTCSVCRKTEGSALGHTWIEATCTIPKTCSVCGETEGGLGEHQLDSKGYCAICLKQIGEAITLSNYSKYFSVKISKNGVESAENNKYYYNVKIDTEPKRDIEFHDVWIEITWYHSSINKLTYPDGHTEDAFRDATTRSNLDDSGDCTDEKQIYLGNYPNAQWSTNTRVFDRWEITDIGGYVIK